MATIKNKSNYSQLILDHLTKSRCRLEEKFTIVDISFELQWDSVQLIKYQFMCDMFLFTIMFNNYTLDPYILKECKTVNDFKEYIDSLLIMDKLTETYFNDQIFKFTIEWIRDEGLIANLLSSDNILFVKIERKS